MLHRFDFERKLQAITEFGQHRDARRRELGARAVERYAERSTFDGHWVFDDRNIDVVGILLVGMSLPGRQARCRS